MQVFHVSDQRDLTAALVVDFLTDLGCVVDQFRLAKSALVLYDHSPVAWITFRNEWSLDLSIYTNGQIYTKGQDWLSPTLRLELADPKFFDTLASVVRSPKPSD